MILELTQVVESARLPRLMTRLLQALLALFLSHQLHALGLATDQVALIGRFGRGPVEQPERVNVAGFAALFASATPAAWPAEMQARQFFRNGGTSLEIVRIDPSRELPEALAGNFQAPALRGTGWVLPFSDLGILLIPELAELDASQRNPILEALRPLAETRHFIVMLDPPPTITTTAGAIAWAESLPQDLDFACALYPRVAIDPAAYSNGTSSERVMIGPSGSVAPVVLRKDAAAGLWEVPAGTDAVIQVEGLDPMVSSGDATTLNTANISLIRYFASYGNVLWGWRSRDTIDVESRYLSVARLRRWMTHTLRRSLSYAANETNDHVLWTDLREQSGDFLTSLFVQGAFAGTSLNEAFFVKCDSSTTTQNDISNHRVNVIIGFSPIRPSEFQVSQITLSTANPSRPPHRGILLITPPSDGKLRLFHDSAPGFRHSVQSGNSTGTASWISAGPVDGDGSWQTSTHPIAEVRRFFRLASESR